MSNMNDTEKRLQATRKELLPVVAAKKVVGPIGYFNMWIGMGIIIVSFSVGGDAITRVTLPWVALATWVGTLICGIFINITGDVGIEHGLPYSAYLRVPFGTKGSSVPALLRGILGCCWFSIQSYYGAIAMNYIIGRMTGFTFDNWYICFVAFIAVQVINAALGIKAIERFANMAAPCIVVISIWIFYQVSVRAGQEGISVWGSFLSNGTNSTDFKLTFDAFYIVMFASLSFWSTHAADSQNLSRWVKAPQTKNWFQRNFNSAMGHIVALPLAHTAMIVIGASTMLVLGNWNPIEALQTSASGPVLVIFLILIVLAQWSTNMGANLLPPAMTFLEVGKKYFGYPMACVIVGLIAIVINPEFIMKNFGSLLDIMGGIYSGIVGVTIVDYYILRKRRLNVPEIYKMDGQYSGDNGWNWAGIISLIVGFLAGLANARLSFLVGIVVSAVLYYILGKFWWFKKHRYAEVESGFDDKYLGISVGHDWVVDEKLAMEGK